jgi:hypothetical protein
LKSLSDYPHIAETDKVPLIPTSTSIKSAKERRESLRKSGAGRDDDGFISLSLTARSKDEGPHPESRLVREEDELGEGEDGQSTSYISLMSSVLNTFNLL